MPRFTIILPFHASAPTIAATLDSLRAQSFTDWEAICVNDRSPDGADRIVADYAARDRRIRLVTNPGTGPSVARNHAATLALGEFFAFCDADDLWAPAKLAETLQAFTPGIAGLFGQIGFFTDSPDDCRTRSTVPTGPLTIAGLLAENPVCTMSNLTLRCDVFLGVGGLDPDAVHNEDLELLIRLVGEGHWITGLDSLQVWYRTTPTGLSSNLPAMRIGRQRALRTAARYGVTPTPTAEAVYFRYLARRALRLDTGPAEAWRFTRAGLRQSATGFLSPPRRGLATALASALSLILTRRLRHALFSH
ncbi:MAG: glycosyltransferase family 2 protein [Phycisphaerales bacterium]